MATFTVKLEQLASKWDSGYSVYISKTSYPKKFVSSLFTLFSSLKGKAEIWKWAWSNLRRKTTEQWKEKRKAPKLKLTFSPCFFLGPNWLKVEVSEGKTMTYISECCKYLDQKRAFILDASSSCWVEWKNWGFTMLNKTSKVRNSLFWIIRKKKKDLLRKKMHNSVQMHRWKANEPPDDHREKGVNCLRMLGLTHLPYLELQVSNGFVGIYLQIPFEGRPGTSERIWVAEGS